MFTTHDAIAMLLERHPHLTQAEINVWYTKGAEAILAFLQATTPAAAEESSTTDGKEPTSPENTENLPEDEAKPKARRSHREA